VTHAIDKNSPLLGLTLEQMEAENGEIIGILDGIDEISSLNYQTRWSFKANEILEGRQFVPCVKRDRATGYFLVDFDRLSKTRVADPFIPPSPSVVKKPELIKLKQISKTVPKRKSSLKRRFSRSLSSSGVRDKKRNSFSFYKTPETSLSNTASSLGGIDEILLDMVKKLPSFGRMSRVEIQPLDSRRSRIIRANTCPSRANDSNAKINKQDADSLQQIIPRPMSRFRRRSSLS